MSITIIVGWKQIPLKRKWFLGIENRIEKAQVRNIVFNAADFIAQPGLDLLIRLIQILGIVRQLLHLD